MHHLRLFLAGTGCLIVFGASLPGCGQKGPLYLPTDPAAASRATLPQLALPSSLRSTTASAPAAPGSPQAPQARPDASPETTPADSLDSAPTEEKKQ